MSKPNDEKHLKQKQIKKIGPIIGISIAGVIVLIAIVLLIVYLFRKSKKSMRGGISANEFHVLEKLTGSPKINTNQYKSNLNG